MKSVKQRSFLKWAGGKYTLMDHILQTLPQGDELIEPFVGSGTVFLNTEYDRYLLSDINPDLIALFNYIKKKPEQFIEEARTLFSPNNNCSDAFYELRTAFNASKLKSKDRSLLFLYLNRHGYNGLCRYNRKGEFNVPFGQYTKIYFPEREIRQFAEKAQRATFVCKSYQSAMKQAKLGSVVYCDPPYYPLPQTQSFTNYHAAGFTSKDQEKLAKLAIQLSNQNIPVLISNHDVPETRQLYDQASIKEVKTRRLIASLGSSRKEIIEILALFNSAIER